MLPSLGPRAGCILAAVLSTAMEKALKAHLGLTGILHGAARFPIQADAGRNRMSKKLLIP